MGFNLTEHFFIIKFLTIHAQLKNCFTWSYWRENMGSTDSIWII